MTLVTNQQSFSSHRTLMKPLGPWLPDLGLRDNPGCIDAKNTLPLRNSYRSAPSLTPLTATLPSPCTGFYWLTKDDGTELNFAGTQTDLYRLLPDLTWQNVTNGGPGSYAGANRWEFVKYGNRLIATNINNAVQYFDVETSSQFADLPGTPPRAARVGVVRDFVVLGDLISSGASNPNYIQWSGANNSEFWGVSPTFQADFAPILEDRGGRVQKVVGGEYGLIFTENNIHRFDYIGPPVIFEINAIDRNRGTDAPDSVVWLGNEVYFYGRDGFYVTKGGEPVNIGHNKVNDWFLQNSEPEERKNMIGTMDRVNHLVFWSFKKSGTTAEYNDCIIVYHRDNGNWSYVEVEAQYIAEYKTVGQSLDTLDSILGNIDQDSILIDSGAYEGGALNVVAIAPDNTPSSFDGPAGKATFVTSEFGGDDGFRHSIHAIRPYYEGSATARAAMAGRQDASDIPTVQTLRDVNQAGEVPIRHDARFSYAVLELTGNFSHARGVQLVVQPKSGRR